MNNGNNMQNRINATYNYEPNVPQQESVAEEVNRHNRKVDSYSLTHFRDHSNKRDLGRSLTKNKDNTNNQRNSRANSSTKSESNIDSSKFTPMNNPKSNQSHFNNLNGDRGNLENKIATKGASAGLSAVGVPKPLADKVANSKVGQAAIQRGMDYLKKRHPALSAASKLIGARNKKNEETTASGGFLNVELSLVEIVIVAVVCSAIALGAGVVCFISASQTYLNAKKLHQGYSSDMLDTFINEKMTDEQRSAEVDPNTAMQNVVGDLYVDDSNTNFIPVGRVVKKFRKDDLKDLDDYYSAASIYAIENDEEVVYNFFFKMDFIRKHYIKKYGLEPDIPLLMSTLILEDDDMGVVFKNNTIGYDYSKCRTGLFGKYDYTKCIDNSDFDYDHDWSNYTIQEGDSSHDMEILIQHMIHAEATESCTNKDGEVTNTNLLEDENVFKTVLTCEDDETYSVTKPTFEVDDDRYQEFLKEFLEKKYFLNQKEGSSSSGDNGGSANVSNISNEFAKKIVELAYEQIGNTGDKYESAYGVYTDWCVIFVWWLCANTTVDGQSVYPDLVPHKSASTGDYMRYFLSEPQSNLHFYYNDQCSYYSGKNGSSYTPKPGDFVFVDNNPGTPWTSSNDVQDHTAIVVAYEDGKITTVEGNFGPTVIEYSRTLSDCKVIGFGSWY